MMPSKTELILARAIETTGEALITVLEEGKSLSIPWGNALIGIGQFSRPSAMASNWPLISGPLVQAYLAGR